MARPLKQGLDYFSLDTDTDEKIEYIQEVHGIVGFGTLIKLFQFIYKNGYFVNWGKIEQTLIKRQTGLQLDEINEIVNSCLEVGIFNKNLFDKYKILTSHGIQKRFYEVAKKRKEVEVVEEYLLFDKLIEDYCTVSDSKSDENSPETNRKHDGNRERERESKEKEKVKGKESKGKEESIEDAKASVSDKPDDPPFNEVVKHYNNTCRALNPVVKITDRRKGNIRARYREYGIDAIFEVINKASESKFLSGQNKKNWTADFDWIFKPNNFVKVLEGKYDNREGPLKGGNIFFDMAREEGA